MDRRQRKTRQAILTAMVELLSQKDFGQITVSEIIDRADVGRATFYSHFETKDFLLKELCEDLFCHIFDAAEQTAAAHRHLFACDAPNSVFLHLFQHLQKKTTTTFWNCCPVGTTNFFLGWFKSNLRTLITSQAGLFTDRKSDLLPESFWLDHIASTFVETLRWWLDNGRKESPETITEYFFLTV